MGVGLLLTRARAGRQLACSSRLILLYRLYVIDVCLVSTGCLFTGYFRRTFFTDNFRGSDRAVGVCVCVCVSGVRTVTFEII